MLEQHVMQRSHQLQNTDFEDGKQQFIIECISHSSGIWI